MRRLAEDIVALAVAAGAVQGMTKGLMVIKPPKPRASRLVIPPQDITSTPVILLRQTSFDFAIVLFHGDGSDTLTLTVRRGSDTATILGSEQGIELVVDEALEITASAGAGTSPTIEIAGISWQ